jgi:uncharacterized protein with PIN domain
MGGPASPQERFLADAMLGRLARWLRALGYDTSYYPRGEDEFLIRVALAEDRSLVTRDRRLAAVRRPGLRTLLIRANDHEEQLRELAALRPLDRSGMLTRCIECNTLLEDLPPELAEGSVPEYVLHAQRDFKRCPGCGRSYWPGSHMPGIARVLGACGRR